MKHRNLLRQRLLLLFLLSLGLLGTKGCLTTGKKVVFIHTNDTLVRLGPNVKGHVYYWDGTEWELSGKRVTLPEGWVAGPIDLPVGEAE